MKTKRFPRAAAAALCLALLLSLLTPPARAASADAPTDYVALTRWERIDRFDYHVRPGNHQGYFPPFLLTWTNNGSRFYFNALSTDTVSNWGSRVKAFSLTNHKLVNTYPAVNTAIEKGYSVFYAPQLKNVPTVGTNIGAGGGMHYYFEIHLADGKVVQGWEDDGSDLIVDENSRWQLDAYAHGGGVHLTMRNTDGWRFRHLNNGNLYFAHDQSGYEGTEYFDIPYIGTGAQVAQYSSKTVNVNNGQVLVVDQRTYLPKGATITVKRGGVLSVGSYLFNDGRITVEKGGLLVVNADSGILPLTPYDKDCGGITTAGSVVVRSGSILWGGGTNGLNITGGQVINYGVMMGENFRIAQQRTVENKGSGKIYAGYSIGKADDIGALNSVYMLLLGFQRDIFDMYGYWSDSRKYFYTFHDQAYDFGGKPFDFSKLTTDDMGQYLSGQNVTFASGAVTGAGSVDYYTPDDPYAKDPWVMIYGYSSIRSAWETAYYGAKSNLRFEYFNNYSRGRFTDITTGKSYELGAYEYVNVYEYRSQVEGWKEIVPSQELRFWDITAWLDS